MPRKLIRTFAAFCVSFCLIGLMPLRAAAWGQEGHQIVAAIALWRLKQLKATNAINKVNSIFAAKPQMLRRPQDLFAASVWPDKVRRTGPYGFADDLHFVSIPLDKDNDPKVHDKYEKKRDCKAIADIPQVPEGVCIIGALDHYSKVLRESNNKKARLEALSFIVHFMGDLHQPLHTSEDKSFKNHLGKKGDRGGNHRFLFYLSDESFHSDDAKSCLQNPEACSESFTHSNGEIEISNRKLHTAWDTYMIQTEMSRNPNRGPDFRFYARDLIKLLPQNPSAPQYALIEEGSWILWAEESHHAAEQNVYALIGPKTKISPADNEEYDFYLLNEAYRAKNIRIIDKQLMRAGIRLAAVLRRIFPDN